MEFKTYIFKPTGEFAEIEIDIYSFKIDAWTSEIPKLLPLTHTKENYYTYLKEKFKSFTWFINWEDYELITVNLLLS